MRRVPAGCEGVVVIHACTSPHTQQRTGARCPHCKVHTGVYTVAVWLLTYVHVGVPNICGR